MNKLATLVAALPRAVQIGMVKRAQYKAGLKKQAAWTPTQAGLTGVGLGALGGAGLEYLGGDDSTINDYIASTALGAGVGGMSGLGLHALFGEQPSSVKPSSVKPSSVKPSSVKPSSDEHQDVRYLKAMRAADDYEDSSGYSMIRGMGAIGDMPTAKFLNAKMKLHKEIQAEKMKHDLLGAKLGDWYTTILK